MHGHRIAPHARRFWPHPPLDRTHRSPDESALSPDRSAWSRKYSERSPDCRARTGNGPARTGDCTVPPPYRTARTSTCQDRPSWRTAGHTDAHGIVVMHPHANDDRPRARIEEDRMRHEPSWTDGAVALPLARGAPTARAPPRAGTRSPMTVVGPGGRLWRPPRREMQTRQGIMLQSLPNVEAFLEAHRRVGRCSEHGRTAAALGSECQLVRPKQHAGGQHAQR
jgi:hypothetical protein